MKNLPASFVSTLHRPSRSVFDAAATAASAGTRSRFGVHSGRQVVHSSLQSTATVATSQLRDLPAFVPRTQVGIAVGTAVLTTLLLLALIRPLPSSKKESSMQNLRSRRRSLAKVYTLVNVLYTVVGCYYLYGLVVHKGIWTSTATTALERAMNGPFSLGVIFGATQAGYSLWSVLVDEQDAQPGKRWRDEKSIMFLHHLFTIFCGMLMATGTLGYRVYGPFFFGVVEVSSIPLSLRKVLAKGRQFGYESCKLAFVLSFLIARILLWSYFAAFLFHDSIRAISMSAVLGRKAVLVPILGTFPLWVLSFMQYHWACMIVKEFTKGKATKNKKTKTVDDENEKP